MGFRRKSSDLYESVFHLKYIVLLILSKFEEKTIIVSMLIWYSNVQREFGNFSLYVI